MKKLDINKHLEFLKSPKFLMNAAFILLFAILVSKYFFFQTIVGKDNTSKVMVIAPADIEVIDSIKTEKRKREVAQKVNFVYTPADDTYIKNNLNEIIEEIKQIRKDTEMSEDDKRSRLEAMFDMPDSNIKSFVFSFFLNASDEDLDNVAVSSANTLESVLNEGITEKDFEENSLAKIIRRNVEVNTTNNNIKVITALLEQVIVPNMIVDEEATEKTVYYTISGKEQQYEPTWERYTISDLDVDDEFEGRPEVTIFKKEDKTYDAGRIRVMDDGEILDLYVNFPKKDYPYVKGINKSFDFYRTCFDFIYSILRCRDERNVADKNGEEINRFNLVNLETFAKYVDGMERIGVKITEGNMDSEYNSWQIYKME